MNSDEAIPTISDAEWEVMKVLWDTPGLNAPEVHARLQDRRTWKIRTVQTLLGRLVQKGALGFEKNGREYLYHPLFDAETCRRAASNSFITRVFDGRLAPFLATFVESTELSAEEIDELKRLLDEGQEK
ncbi:MAG TPA: BlaI/MecI/CopY family transcriptional regulator [Verrucomicrobiales bacterium]|nr:BlaI/MecI/CopY family transcriptional regulator [Verrucomicrobiales bacterium]